MRWVQISAQDAHQTQYHLSSTSTTLFVCIAGFTGLDSGTSSVCEAGTSKMSVGPRAWSLAQQAPSRRPTVQANAASAPPTPSQSARPGPRVASTFMATPAPLLPCVWRVLGVSTSTSIPPCVASTVWSTPTQWAAPPTAQGRVCACQDFRRGGEVCEDFQTLAQCLTRGAWGHD